MIAAIDKILQDAVASGAAPVLAAIAVDRDGVIYQGQAGPQGAGHGAGDDRPLNADAVFQIHSMTKAIAATGVMQLVEAAKLDLDAPAGDILPELADPEVLTGFDGDGKPELRPAKTTVTLRNLLTHTSGFVYDQWNANQYAWLKASGAKRGDYYGDVAKRPPLAFDPGARWEYGIGIDWAGKMLEAVTGETLEAYLRTKVLGPLGMTSTGYVADDAIRARMAGVWQRQPDGRIDPVPDFEHPRLAPAAFSGGGGLYSTAKDYARFLRMILNRGELDGARLVRPETVDLMAANSIGDVEVRGLPTTMPNLTWPFDFYPGQPKRWGLSFMINMTDVPGARRAGTLSWGGLRNSYFWIDPASGIGGAIFAQMLPFADPKVLAAYDAFERAIYASQ